MNEIEALQQEKQDIEENLDFYFREMQKWQHTYSTAKKRIKEINKLIRDKEDLIKQREKEKQDKIIQKTKELTVSDHAVVRYIERVMGVNIEEVKHNIITDGLREYINKTGVNGKFPIGNGVRAIVENKVVVTIV